MWSDYIEVFLSVDLVVPENPVNARHCKSMLFSQAVYLPSYLYFRKFSKLQLYWLVDVRCTFSEVVPDGGRARYCVVSIDHTQIRASVTISFYLRDLAVHEPVTRYRAFGLPLLLCANHYAFDSCNEGSSILLAGKQNSCSQLVSATVTFA